LPFGAMPYIKPCHKWSHTPARSRTSSPAHRWCCGTPFHAHPFVCSSKVRHLRPARSAVGCARRPKSARYYVSAKCAVQSQPRHQQQCGSQRLRIHVLARLRRFHQTPTTMHKGAQSNGRGCIGSTRGSKEGHDHSLSSNNNNSQWCGTVTSVRLPSALVNLAASASIEASK